MTCTSPVMIHDGYKGFMTVPCGKCIGCKMDKARDWSVRIQNEAKMHDESVFITLTYDDEHLPEDRQLHKKDVQNFMKRLREYIKPDKVRYFLCGEYGDTFMRPHFHIICFGLSKFDARVFKDHCKACGGYVVKCKAWDLGRVHLGNVTNGSAGYVARYTIKKAGKDSRWYKDNDLVPEFIQMSLRPGIGFGFMQKFKNDILTGFKVIVNGHKYRIPRYYKDKLDLKNNLGYQLYLADLMEKSFNEAANLSPEEFQRAGVKYVEELRQKNRNNQMFNKMKGR